MKRKKEFIKNIEAKAKVTLITITLVVLAISAGLLLTTNFVDTAKADYAYSDFAYWKHIVIDHSFVDSTLTNFPVLVHDDTGDLLGDIQADANDVAFFNYDNSSQYNHEIDFYNSTTGELWAWVNITSLSSSAETNFYMYYGDSDGGYSPGYNPESVWDSDYRTVHHFTGASVTAIDDSTSNNYDLDSEVGNPTYNIPAQAGKSIYFDGDYDGVKWNDFAMLPSTGDFTFEVWVKTEAGLETTGKLFECYVGGSTNAYWSIRFFHPTGDYPRWYADTQGYVDSTTNFKNTWKEFVVTRDGNDFEVIVDQTVQDTDTSAITYTADSPLPMGTGYTMDGAEDYQGWVDEFRISTVERSMDWLEVTNDTFLETAGFMTLGTESVGQIPPSVYTLNGLSSPYGITWSGTAGTTVWNNNSGDNYEYMEINLSVNASDNVTELRIWVDDMNDTGAYINASNITLFISSDNSSIGELGTFADGGSNLSINTSTWNDGTMGANPFLGEGINNKSQSIWCRFRLSIPVDAPTDTFTSLATDSWKVYIGYYT